jgi:DNA-binding MarR family transcriptional regulator
MTKKIEDIIQQKKAFQNIHQKAGIGLLLAGRNFENQTYLVLKEYGISLPQFNVLRILRGSHPRPMTLNDIRSRMVDDQSDVSRIVGRLSDQGLITSIKQENNRRACDVNITEVGLKKLASLDPAISTIQIEGLTTEEIQQLITLLEKLL